MQFQFVTGLVLCSITRFVLSCDTSFQFREYCSIDNFKSPCAIFLFLPLSACHNGLSILHTVHFLSNDFPL